MTYTNKIKLIAKKRGIIYACAFGMFNSEFRRITGVDPSDRGDKTTLDEFIRRCGYTRAADQAIYTLWGVTHTDKIA